ncbi:hypothetical protein BEI02_03635 [Elizabethkingia sp. HvH-WGS333]|uniref:helix-turn-helix domain-containing protein n=1 Tax=Elizabethkingia TaxID=308865 RepID=UPI00074156D2|nr:MULTISPECIES: helix-turn-helix domain-containing protein [Elizabethkingia]KUG13736.1 hypothetical protein AMC91_00330 [Elizabethkingia miricola]MCL1658288.1 helix-turn-helix domain-containing protein [Elizabethkingia miricola]OIK46127.1 hypothetical protein BEI02_03635 [Elizabethkingia sp. HvH-WGS333]
MQRIPQYEPDKFKSILDIERVGTGKIFNDFFIEPLSVLSSHARMPSLPHRKTVNDFVFVSKGELEKMVCSDSFIIGEGMFMFLPVYKIRTIIRNTQDVQGFYCHFSDEFIVESGIVTKQLKEIFHYTELTSSPAVQLDNDHNCRVNWILEQIIKLYEEDNNINLIRAYFSTLISELHHFTQSKPLPVFSPKETLTLRFRKLITSHVQDIHTTQEYAKLLNVSPNHLNKCVKSTIGKTASDLINEALLMEAKALLSMSQYSVAEVAFTLGFEDASYFSRFFKKHAVQSPTEFRRMIDLSC